MKEIGLEEFESTFGNATIIDVLPRPSYRSGHIPDAINLPNDEIETEANAILPDFNAAIVVYCGGPQCPLGRQAQQQLMDLGYRNVTHYLGGLEEWTRLGRPLHRQLASRVDDDPGNRLLELIDSLSLNQWIGVWMWMTVGCATIYWAAGFLGLDGLNYQSKPLVFGLSSLGDCLYFSVVTATTLGYGDITPVTWWARVLASSEAIAGMVIVGALISKLLSTHQEKLINETNGLAFTERVGRIQTSLHLLISEFQDIRSDHDDGKPQNYLDLRLASGSALLIRDLGVVRDLLHDRDQRADETSLELVLITLSGSLQGYLEVLTVCSQHKGIDTKRLGNLVEEICSDCIPFQYSDTVTQLIEKTHVLAQQILGVSRSQFPIANSPDSQFTREPIQGCLRRLRYQRITVDMSANP